MYLCRRSPISQWNVNILPSKDIRCWRFFWTNDLAGVINITCTLREATNWGREGVAEGKQSDKDVCWGWKKNCVNVGFLYLLITLSKWHWLYYLNQRICFFSLYAAKNCDKSIKHDVDAAAAKKERRKEKEITSRSALTSVVQEGPANYSEDTCKLVDVVQKLTFHLSQHTSNIFPTGFCPTLLWFPPICWSEERSGARALFDVWADTALRDWGPCAVSMKAIKNLNLCHKQNRPCIQFSLLSFFILPFGKIAKELFWIVLVVFALKRTISMPECALTQLAMCIQTLIALVFVRQISSDVPLVFAQGSRNMTLVARMHRRVYEKAAMQQSPRDWSHLFQTRLGS